MRGMRSNTGMCVWEQTTDGKYYKLVMSLKPMVYSMATRYVQWMYCTPNTST